MSGAPDLLDPDQPLITAMARGDASALADLMDRHLIAVKSAAWHLLHDDSAAEDVAQETFLKAWVKAGQWQAGSARYKTWLIRVATNDCLSRLRKKKELLPETLPERADERPSAEQSLVSGERDAVVRAAIAQLPDRQRAAITLAHYQGVSQSEGAHILEISESAYESLLARARRALRDTLSPIMEPKS